MSSTPTWAQRAQSLSSSDPTSSSSSATNGSSMDHPASSSSAAGGAAASAAMAPSSGSLLPLHVAPMASSSKASTSDNWRADSSLHNTHHDTLHSKDSTADPDSSAHNDDGWVTLEKKDRSSRKATHTPAMSSTSFSSKGGAYSKPRTSTKPLNNSAFSASSISGRTANGVGSHGRSSLSGPLAPSLAVAEATSAGPSSSLAVAPAGSSMAASDPSHSRPASLTVPTPALPASRPVLDWADDTDDSLPPLPSPTFPTTALPPTTTAPSTQASTPALSDSPDTPENASTVASTPIDEHTITSSKTLQPQSAGLASESASAPSPAPFVPTPVVRQPAPVPTVNVWAVRKDQLAAAAAAAKAAQPVAPNSASAPTASSSSAATTTVSGSAQNPTGTSPAPASKKSAAKLAKKEAAAKAAAAAAVKSGPRAPTSSLTPPPPPSATLNSSPTPAPTAAQNSTSTPIIKRSTEGWNGVPSAPLPVPVGDVESWPSPNTEAAKPAGPVKKYGSAANASNEAEIEEAQNKKKAEKTKWIPIKADITVNPTSSSRLFGASGEKRVPKSGTSSRREFGGADKGAEENGVGGASKRAAGEKKPKSAQASVAAAAASTPAHAGSAKNANAASTSSSNPASTRPTDHPLPSKPNSSPSSHLPAQQAAPSTSSPSAQPATSAFATLTVAAASKSAPALKNGAQAATEGDSASSAPKSAPNATVSPTSATAPSANKASASQSSSSVSVAVPNAPTSQASKGQPTPNGNAQAPFQNGTSTHGRHLGSGTTVRGGLHASRGGPTARGGRSGSMSSRGGYQGSNPRGPASSSSLHQAQQAQAAAQQPHGAGYLDPTTAYWHAQAAYGTVALPDAVAPWAYEQAQPYVDPRVLDPTRYWLLGQLEWYFSVDNLCRDMYLRSKMDAAGWIEITIIASFNRIKNLTSDRKIVRDTMILTPMLEVSGEFVRLRQHWPEWVLPSAIPARIAHSHHVPGLQMAAAVTASAFVPPSPASSLTNKKRREESEASSEDGGEGTAATTISSGSQAEDVAPAAKEETTASTTPSTVTA
ncbi:hypothetical protein MVLG_01645 [Microbotryum lychnidis-dioicae p1A1 Lamole]|uniref:HTH La-type RNA-binding domain-containing protein n=1 Tax=Microbotryum lychnidis-dioicae (strain p1A1 Lamole / MvSl-1064) TaxID=683840 RepID=U5H2R2_USTV1|nr:hypothetical protein MVLG_01645 [Microbotryum lychnidis-dioicae p1A1 Lamole]|eukprot:KDE08165.1 hypothetical protein MVLG_01645 [Microbotryum lychnidis-dioicae p1A1 Lamole]